VTTDSAQIPIYSLDASWLWCETWCDDESKAKAIDLCNPMTKTPKLENAVRIVEEWPELDQEARAVRPLEQDSQAHAHADPFPSSLPEEQWTGLKQTLPVVKEDEELIAIEDAPSNPFSHFFGGALILL
jgi:hypothetical protein